MTWISRSFAGPRLAAALVGSGLWAGSASAVIVQNTGGTLPSDIPTQALGTWGNNAGAVAVGSEWVLTTRHQDNGQLNRQVEIDGQTYNARVQDQIILDPAVDLRLVRLTDVGTGDPANLSTTVDIFTGNPVNQTAVITGYGPTIGSADPGGDGFNLSGPANNSNGLSIGQNRIQNITTVASEFPSMSVISADFDDAAGFGDVPFEATLAGGDSGGAWFLQQDGEWKLAGLTHAIDPPFRGPAPRVLRAEHLRC